MTTYLFALLGWPELVLIGVVITAFVCWRVFSQSDQEKKDE
jgi:hypothetical protein